MDRLYQPLCDADPVLQDDADPVLQDDADPVLQDDADPVLQDNADCGHWALRLITLLPGIPGSTIVCQLDHSTLHQSRGQYEPLSYVWGDPMPSHTVIVDSHQISVTPNLAQNLQHLRYATKSRRFWIDALCIDQTDAQERGLQVQRMGAIYEHASRAVVFLGIEADRSAEAINLLILISQLTLGDHGGIDALLSNDTLATSWKALQRLIQRPWWSRAWIVQAYATASEVVFVCGIEEVDGRVFARALENLVDYRFKSAVPRQHERLIRNVASTSIHHLWSTRCKFQDIQSRSSLHALGVLYKFRGSQCVDPRDKVSSIFGLVKQDSLLTPDYTKSTAQVYKAVVKAAIHSSGTLEILAHHNLSKASKLDLPTWCPDWTIRRGTRILLWPN